MIKTLNPYNTNTQKTAEIMSRYRPIAPKPETPANSAGENPSLSQKIRESPYLRNLWPQLQARPTRTRKRGRSALSPTTFKRQRTHHVFGFSTPCHVTSPAKNLTLDGFAHALSQLPIPTSFDAVKSTNLMTLPLLQYPPPPPPPPSPPPPPPSSVPVVTNQAMVPAEFELIKPCEGEEKLIDLNTVAEIPEEKDLLQQLQGISPTPTPINVIAPQPVRPVGSSISVGCIKTDPSLAPAEQAPKKPEDVEDEVESEALPSIISDSHNKVRMANSAYKEMVGQPECSWLDSMVTSDGRFGGSSCKRISGEVILELSEAEVPVSSNGFSCWVRIEWGNEMDKHAIHAFCDVIKLSCETKDYLFSWRFHTHSKEGSQSSSSNA
ncbi:PREDICTED: LOW QUALITY PROTEIN [Prunus dulcis]|uniref:PREDICTED: LOW QUALITY PROTEIN n=1 Tax=Prunus dulcis TaxID=3755 RepID=A0A5E4E9F9_PRUDU|nr:uncharacterized protein LOC117638722 [Prunus dulcis]KAI5354317.1 hypothetical protein L3X38_007212 [Prunus dulcis]VVA11916.1 PREDICTED: LOW QUALITY PROTEIN [Prunus dulcis]